jgi:hypothetical protein
VMSAWQQYFWIAPVHPAALLLVLSLAACALLALRPQATTALALLCTAAVLAKQSGVALLVGVVIHLAIADRPRLRRFCVVSALALGVAVGLGELQSHGQFLRSILFYPNQAFSGVWLSWHNSFTLLAGFYGGRLWLVPLVACGLWAARRTWLWPLAVVFVVDGAVQLDLARSVAGSASYYWFHFALAAILAAHGWRWLMTVAAAKLRGLGARPSVPALLALLVGLIVLASDGRDLFALPRQDLSRATEISQRHADAVTALVAANRDRKWIVTRSSLAAVRAGALLDQEYATFAIAWTAPGLVDRAAVRRRVAAGEYGFVQLGPTSLTFDPLADVFAACFAPVARSTLVYMGQPAPATFLRYDGTGPLCQSLAAAR